MNPSTANMLMKPWTRNLSTSSRFIASDVSSCDWRTTYSRSASLKIRLRDLGLTRTPFRALFSQALDADGSPLSFRRHPL